MTESTESTESNEMDAPAPLKSILCTDELNKRPRRPPDFESENRALSTLAQALADSPRTVLQTLADAIRQTLKCDSAGISLLTEDGKRFYWPAISGSWKVHIGGGTPRDFGPCGDVLDCNTPLMFRHVERRYTYFQPVTPQVEEALLVPFHVEGKAVGTIWAVAHDDRRKFDNEDLRQLVSLAWFASSAYRAHAAMDMLEKYGEARTGLAAIVDSSDDAIVAKSLEGIIISWNRAAEKMFGHTAAEAIGQHITLIIPHERRGEANEVIARIRRGEKVDHFETVRRTKDGRRLNISLSVSPIRNAAGQIVGASKVARDITERKRFENEREAHLKNEQLLRKEAENANRAKDVFLATLSHELRTPLSAIVGWTSILRGQDCDENDLREGLEAIERNTKAQLQLIDDVLDVARMVSGKLRLEVRPCELTDVVKAGVDVVRPAADAREITLNVQLDPSASRASCDPVRIQQVVWNLLNNAVKFTPKGGTVGVALTREKSTVQIQIRDSGQGITPELLPYVFDRFRQADSSTRRRFGGLGLGLSIVKQIVELHGGTVEALSPGEGKGSAFTVRLPIRAVQINEDGQEQSDSSDAKTLPLPDVHLDGLRLLVVDDEPDARRLLVKVLQDAGAIVTAAGSAAEALDVLPKAQPEVLVSDIGMPDVDGFDLIRKVRGSGHHPKDLPAVALTAFAHKSDQRQALLAGFQVHIPKPVDPHDLLAVVASLAGRTS
jgi:PAS domain S-box-containing protein